MSNRDFTPVQEVLLAAIKAASLRFMAPEITPLRRALEELADRLDQWTIASRPVDSALPIPFPANRPRGEA